MDQGNGSFLLRQERLKHPPPPSTFARASADAVGVLPRPSFEARKSSRLRMRAEGDCCGILSVHLTLVASGASAFVQMSGPMLNGHTQPPFQTSALSRAIWKPALIAYKFTRRKKAGFQLALRKGYAWLE